LCRGAAQQTAPRMRFPHQWGEHWCSAKGNILGTGDREYVHPFCVLTAPNVKKACASGSKFVSPRSAEAPACLQNIANMPPSGYRRR
jgi:hypothetical protein